jgi:hypothetical protein
MGIYKNYLLNITCWAIGLDLFLSLLYVPQIAFPESGLCSLGVLDFFNGHVAQTVFLVGLGENGIDGVSVGVC